MQTATVRLMSLSFIVSGTAEYDDLHIHKELEIHYCGINKCYQVITKRLTGSWAKLIRQGSEKYAF